MNKQLIIANKKKWLSGLVALVCVVSLSAVACTNNSKKAAESPKIEQKKSSKKSKSKPKLSPSEKKKIDKIVENDKKVGEETAGRLGTDTTNQIQSILNQDTGALVRALNTPTEKPKQQPMVTPNPIDPVIPPAPKPEPPVSPVEPPIVTTTPKLHLAAGSIVLGQNTLYDPFDYFFVTDSGDSAPKVTVSTINTSVLGWQTLYIQVTNKFGNSVQGEIAVFVNAVPILSKLMDVVEVPLRSSVDFLKYVSAIDSEDGVITPSITYSTNGFDNQKEGSYTVVYNVKDSHGFMAIPVEIVFNVTNEAPVIHAKDIDIEIDQPFEPLEFATVTDREDGPITLTAENILENTVDTSKEGTYSVTYGNVKDSHGKPAKDVTIQVTVVNEAPKIEVPDYTLSVGDTFNKDTYKNSISVTDREDDKQGKPLTVTFDEAVLSSIDTSKAGEYLVTITAVDSHGKTTIKTGKISIIEGV